MRPLIGLNTTVADMDDPLKSKALCHLAYIDAVANAGGIPIVIPPYTDMTMLERALEPLDGFCLIGGPDYLPSHYGGHEQPPADLMHERRHHFDIALGALLLKKSKRPVLGICGGHQLISITMGGALVQDLKSEWKPKDSDASTLIHAGDQRKGTPQEGNVYRHEIRVQPESRIGEIIGAKKLMTNSFHHQAVRLDRVGEGLVPTAWAPDGVIEAIEARDASRFVVGVQWHPERQQDDGQHRAIFTALVKAATASK